MAYNELSIDTIMELLNKINKVTPIHQKAYMNEAIHNKNFNTFENELNILYEKTRLLELLNNKIEYTLLNEITAYEKELKEKLTITENLVDMFLDKEQETMLIPIVDSNEEAKDRSGSIIPAMVISNNTLEVKADTLASTTFKNINKLSKNYPTTLNNKLNAISIYKADEIILDGLNEEIVLSLKSPGEYNYIKIEPINASINKIIAIDNEKVETVLEKNGYDKNKFFLNLKLILNNQNYIKKDNKYVYKQGIKNIVLEKRRPKKASAFISQEMDVKDCEYLTLAIDKETTGALFEYYIIDGEDTFPILPYDHEDITTELLFAGKNPIYTKRELKDYTIYKDNIKTNYTIEDIEKEDLLNNDFTIKYEVDKDFKKYKPKNDKIKIKVIERVVNDVIPSTIYSLAIKKYGGLK